MAAYMTIDVGQPDRTIYITQFKMNSHVADFPRAKIHAHTHLRAHINALGSTSEHMTADHRY